ncbi:MAG: hypothetical protein ACRDSJ_17835 [Rubrobacteraceae bacterium]
MPGVLRRLFGAAVVLWILAVAVFFMVESSTVKVSATFGAYWTVAAFAGVAVASAMLGSDGFERTFWLLLGGGLMLRFAGHMSWTGFQFLGVYSPGSFMPHDLFHLISYALLIGALLWLVTQIAVRATPLARFNALLIAFDALFVVVSVGSLVWYFVLGPVADSAGIDTAREVFAALRRPACDAGLLFLSLLVLSATRRPSTASP